MNKKVAIYIRVSTEHQIDKESLPVQRRELINYSKYILNIDNFEVFEDAGYSGKNTNRPALQNMLHRIEMYEFSHLLVWKLDRISRNIIDFSKMFEQLKKYQVTFISKNEQFDTSNAIGEAVIKFMMIFAELERNQTAERVTSVMMSKAENGDWNGGRIPFGYDYNKEERTFSINQPEADIVRLIYKCYLENKSMTKVADYLKEHNILNRNSNNFSTVTVSIILNSLFYTGIYRYNYRKAGNRQKIKNQDEWITISDHHPAIITLEEYESVKQIREKNRRFIRSNKQTIYRTHTHIFSGLLTCICGGNMVAHIGSQRANGYRPSTYCCHNRSFGHKCQNPYVSDPYLGNFVMNFISNMYKAYNSFGKTTSLETFSKKILKGKTFDDIEKAEGLNLLYDCFKYNDDKKSEFIHGVINSADSQNYEFTNQTNILMNEKRKYERALERLKSLYLFSDNSISESDYIKEKNILEQNIKVIVSKLDENTSDVNLNDNEFIKLASCFLIEEKLSDKREIDFVKLATSTDTKIIQNFINNMFQNFCIKNGKIISLTFKNGIKIKFFYKV